MQPKDTCASCVANIISAIYLKIMYMFLVAEEQAEEGAYWMIEYEDQTTAVDRKAAATNSDSPYM